MYVFIYIYVPAVVCDSRNRRRQMRTRPCVRRRPSNCRIDTDEMELVGPVYEGENKWYGGLKAPNGTIWGTRCKEYPQSTRGVPAEYPT